MPRRCGTLSRSRPCRVSNDNRRRLRILQEMADPLRRRARIYRYVETAGLQYSEHAQNCGRAVLQEQRNGFLRDVRPGPGGNGPTGWPDGSKHRSSRFGRDPRTARRSGVRATCCSKRRATSCRVSASAKGTNGFAGMHGFQEPATGAVSPAGAFFIFLSTCPSRLA